MEDLIGVVIFLVFAGLSVAGRVMKNQEKQGQGQPKWPGPVAGPGIPGRGQLPRPRPPQGQAPPSWPQPSLGQPRPQPVQPPTGEVVGTEGVSSMLGGSIEGQSSMATGTLAEKRARFRSQTEELLSSRVESTLHRSDGAAEVVQFNQPVNLVVQALSSPEGLAQGVLLAEVLGRPRAVRPHGKR